MSSIKWEQEGGDKVLSSIKLLKYTQTLVRPQCSVTLLCKKMSPSSCSNFGLAILRKLREQEESKHILIIIKKSMALLKGNCANEHAGLEKQESKGDS